MSSKYLILTIALQVSQATGLNVSVPDAYASMSKHEKRAYRAALARELRESSGLPSVVEASQTQDGYKVAAFPGVTLHAVDGDMCQMWENGRNRGFAIMFVDMLDEHGMFNVDILKQKIERFIGHN